MSHFEGQVRTQWLRHSGPDRRMRLLEDFAFVDDNNIRWLAPAGSTIDGASIPETFWFVAGTPYIGDYRRASVLHDVACQEKSRPPRQVHRMFYDAMIRDGVPEARAQQMYTAVRLFGPTWVVAGGPEGAIVAPRTLTIDELEAALDAALGE
jgi:hypothetical protein